MRIWNLMILCSTLPAFLTGCQEEAKTVSDSSKTTVAEIARHAPQHARVLFENDYVIAAEFTVPPGEGIPTHYGRNRAVYALADYRMQFEREGIKSVEEPRAATISWQSAGMHSARNIGDTPARYLVVYRKLSRLFEYSLTGETEDIVCVAPEMSEVLLENETMRVTRLSLAPGSSLPEHRGLNRVVYALSSFDLRYITDAVNMVHSCHSGDVLYFHAEAHAAANVGTTEARYLLFELRE